MSTELIFPVPSRFQRGAFGGRKLVTTGKEILDLVLETAGIDDFGGLDLLDYGCGHRMPQVLLEYDMPFGSYTGIDIDPDMIGWLRANNPDPRMRFDLVPFENALYRPEGEVMSAESSLPLGDQQFDVIMMFSVVTHLDPRDTANLFKILRRYIKPDGFVFFSAFVNPIMDEEFVDGRPEEPLWMAIFQEAFLFGLLDDAGFAAEYYAEPLGKVIQHHLLCRPTDDPHPPRPPRIVHADR